MAARNNADDIKSEFRRRIRREHIGLIYSGVPGGEGRVVSDAEARRFVGDMDRAVDLATIWLRRSAITSFVAPFALGFLAVSFTMPVLGRMAVAFLLTWVIAWCFFRWQRWQLERRLWAAVERRPAVPALTRRERIKKGYSLALWNWLWMLPFAALVFAIKAPDSIVPDRWQAAHSQLQLATILVGAVGLAGILLFRLLRKWRPSR
jgi:hypothetical protein